MVLDDFIRIFHKIKLVELYKPSLESPSLAIEWSPRKHSHSKSLYQPLLNQAGDITQNEESQFSLPVLTSEGPLLALLVPYPSLCLNLFSGHQMLSL